MLPRVLTVVLFIAIMGLLVAQRFSLPPSLPTQITAVYEESNYHTGETLKRGQSVVTPGSGYLAISIGENIQIFMAANTELTLERLYENEMTVHLTKGRILVDAQGDVPIKVETNFTQHLVLEDIVSFINYDFLETVHVVPISGSVQVSIDSGENLLTPVPLSIHETDPVTFEKLEVNLAAGDAAKFYEWTGTLPQVTK
ncbi:hypothetical protein HY626_00835 [Candidatus Uhrbacteria bacterium]|nr:hypothetical protein [Candidatus Uhrbacteria bacterium]